MSQELNNPAADAVKPGMSSPNAGSGGSSMGDTFLSSLSDLESRINAIKQLHEQTSQRESGIATREQELARRESTLANLSEQLDRQKAEIEAFRARMESTLEQTRAEQEAQGQELARQAAQLEEHRRTAQQRVDELEKRERETVRGHEELKRLQAAVSEATERAEKDEAERERLLQSRERDLEEREKNLAALRVKAEAELMRAQREEEETHRTQTRLEELERAVRERENSIQERERTLAEDRKRAGEDESRLMQELADRERNVETRVHELDEREFDIKRLRDELERERAGVTEQARTLAQQMKARDDEHNAAIWANRMEEMQMQYGEATAAKARMETELQQARAEIESITQELLNANAERGVPKDEVERLRQQISELKRQQEEDQATVNMLQQHLDASIKNARGAEEQRTRDLAEMERKLEALNTELAEKAKVAQERQSVAEQRERDLRAIEEKQRHLTEKLDAAMKGIAQAESAASKARGELENSVPRSQFEKTSRELAAAKDLLEQAEKVAKNQVSSSVVKERDALIAGLQQALTEAERSAAELRKQEVEERDATINQLRTQLKNAEETQSASIAGEIQRCEATITELRLRLQDAEAAGERLSSAEIASRDEQIRSLTEQLTSAQQAATLAAAAEIQRRDRRIAELEARLAGEGESVGIAPEEHARQVAARDKRISILESKLVRAEQALSVSASPGALEERERRIAELEERLDKSAAQQADDGIPEEEITKRDEAIVLLRERLDQALAERGELIDRVKMLEETANAPVEPVVQDAGPTDADLRRRDRLRKYKSMLQGQARKILAAQQAIQRRHVECETILQQRQKLAQAAQQLAKVEKKVTGSKARTGAAAALLYMVATLAILAGLSWEVSKRIWPGTYIARAVIEADVGRRTPQPEELAAWQKDHQEMLADPRLAEFTSERMKQRGLANVGTAADLSERLKQDLYMQSGKPGAITLELRGEGAERTQLVLDTLVTSFKAVSDMSREERTNDIGVIIAQAAQSGTEPLLDKRIEKAASVFAGAALAAGLAGLVIWSRLVRAKRKFDQASAVEAAIAEVDWSTLEASMKKGPGKSDMPGD